MEVKTIHSTDRAAYGASTSLVNYLLAHGDVPKLLWFTVTGKKSRWYRTGSRSTAFVAATDLDDHGL